MAKYRAIAPGYYGDVLRDPDGPHAVFEAPKDFKASWAEKVDKDTPPAEPKEPEKPKEVPISDVKPQEDGTVAVEGEDGVVEVM